MQRLTQEEIVTLMLDVFKGVDLSVYSAEEIVKSMKEKLNCQEVKDFLVYLDRNEFDEIVSYAIDIDWLTEAAEEHIDFLNNFDALLDELL